MDNNITKSFKTENVMICDSPNYNCWLLAEILKPDIIVQYKIPSIKHNKTRLK